MLYVVHRALVMILNLLDFLASDGDIRQLTLNGEYFGSGVN